MLKSLTHLERLEEEGIHIMRDNIDAEAGMELLVHQKPEANEKEDNAFYLGSIHPDFSKTQGLKQALELVAAMTE